MPTENGKPSVKLSLPLVCFYSCIIGNGSQLTTLQEYQQDLFTELRSEDELVILARGLGLLRIVTNLLHSFDAVGSSLIVVVGADERENGWIGEALAEQAAVSKSTLARGLNQVSTEMMSVGTRLEMSRCLS